MGITDGTTSSLPPASELTMSWPKTAVKSTASHITMIASAAHISGSCSRRDHSLLVRMVDGSCWIVVITPPFRTTTLPHTRGPGIGEFPYELVRVL
jgi:hypothetical protein